jgi:hypothetical protein
VDEKVIIGRFRARGVVKRRIVFGNTSIIGQPKGVTKRAKMH